MNWLHPQNFDITHPSTLSVMTTNPPPLAQKGHGCSDRVVMDCNRRSFAVEGSGRLRFVPWPHELGCSDKSTVRSVRWEIGSRTATDGRRDNQPARRCRLGCGGPMPARNGGRSSCYWGDMEATVLASAMSVHSSSWLLSIGSILMDSHTKFH